jgi:hypothetical protein
MEKDSEIKKIVELLPVVSAWAITGNYDHEGRISNPLGNDIVYNGQLLRSSKHYYYIGHTKNHVFFFNDQLKSIDVLTASLVTKMTLKY